MHETLKEYLVAEYYVESLIENKIHRLNVGLPTKETIEFLVGLIELLRSEDPDVIKFIEQNEEGEISLLNSFNYDKGLKAARSQLSNSALQSINRDSIVFTSKTNESPWRELNMTYLWAELKINIDDFKNLWLHKWISLCVFTRLAQKVDLEKIEKNKMIMMLKYSSNMMPIYLMNQLNLTEVSIDGVDTLGANLIGADLSNAQR